MVVIAIIPTSGGFANANPTNGADTINPGRSTHIRDPATTIGEHKGRQCCEQGHAHQVDIITHPDVTDRVGVEEVE